MTEVVAHRDRSRELSEWLQNAKIQEALAQALPRTFPVERFMRLVLNDISRNPKLAECSSTSILGGMLEAAALGLEVNVLGHCWLVPYWNSRESIREAQLIVGYKGLVKLAYNSEAVSCVTAGVVREGDEFDYQLGTDRYLHHRLNPSGAYGDITHAYAIVETTRGGRPLIDVMTLDDILRVRDRAKAKDSGPWNTDFEAMAAKTPLRRVMKLAPVSTEAARAVELDELAEAGAAQLLGKAMAGQGIEVPALAADAPDTGATVPDPGTVETEKLEGPAVPEREVGQPGPKVTRNKRGAKNGAKKGGKTPAAEAAPEDAAGEANSAPAEEEAGGFDDVGTMDDPPPLDDDDAPAEQGDLL
jgi:recombination protein RecT